MSLAPPWDSKVNTTSGLTSTQVRGSVASASITVVSTAVTHLGMGAPATAIAGTPVSVTVTALDASNTPVTNYIATIHFTSTDAAATLPPDGLIANGTGTFSATLRSIGPQTIAATDTANSLIGVSGAIVVSLPPKPNLVVTTVADDAGNATNCTPQTTPGTGTDAACGMRDALLYASNAAGGNITFDSIVFAELQTTATVPVRW